MFGELQAWHVIVIVLVAFLLFGAKRMPDMARSVGQSLRIFKSEMRQGAKESEEVAKSHEPAPVVPVAVVAPAPVAPAAVVAPAPVVSSTVGDTVEQKAHS